MNLKKIRKIGKILSKAGLIAMVISLIIMLIFPSNAYITVIFFIIGLFLFSLGLNVFLI